MQAAPPGARHDELRCRVFGRKIALEVMRWFTHDFEYRFLDDADKRHRRYAKHLEALRPELPEGFRMHVAAGGFISLHDATFIRTAWQDGRTVVLDMAASGWFADASQAALIVRFVYTGADLVRPKKRRAFYRRVVQAHAEVLYDEIDRAKDGRFEHRMLLWPEKAPEIVVRFEDVQIVAVEFEGTTATALSADDPRMTPGLPGG
jgi:hypothetical protein